MILYRPISTGPIHKNDPLSQYMDCLFPKRDIYKIVIKLNLFYKYQQIIPELIPAASVVRDMAI
jgi:hypothetical protein